eukprot:12000605-Prorocentrum_lima.AAC.2
MGHPGGRGRARPPGLGFEVRIQVLRCGQRGLMPQQGRRSEQVANASSNPRPTRAGVWTDWPPGRNIPRPWQGIRWAAAERVRIRGANAKQCCGSRRAPSCACPGTG